MRKIIIVSLILMLLMTGCFAKKSETLSAVKIGFFPNVTHAQALMGKSLGTYEQDMKLPLEWKQFNAGPAELEAILAGELDLGFIGPGPAINGFAKSKGDVVILAGAANAGAILVVGENSGIGKIVDLAGKRVAVPQFGNTQDLCLRALIHEAGLKETTRGGNVEIVQVANADVQALLEKRDIDAALVPEPWGALLEKKAAAKVLLDSNQIWRSGKYPTTVVVARKEFIEEHPDLVEKFLVAHVKLTKLLQENSSQSAKTINAEMLHLTKKEIAEDILLRSLKRISFTYDPEEDAVLEMIDLSLEAAFLKDKPDTKGLFSLELLKKVKGK